MLEKSKDKVLDDELLDGVNGGIKLDMNTIGLSRDLVYRGNRPNAQTTQADMNNRPNPQLLGNANMPTVGENKIVSGGAYGEDNIFDMGKC